MQAYLELKTWPDALRALETMRKPGVRLAYLSNMTPLMLRCSGRYVVRLSHILGQTHDIAD